MPGPTEQFIEAINRRFTDLNERLRNLETSEAPAGAAEQLSDLSDVNSATPTAGNVLRADGIDWESMPLSTYAVLHSAIGGASGYVKKTGVGTYEALDEAPLNTYSYSILQNDTDEMDMVVYQIPAGELDTAGLIRMRATFVCENNKGTDGVVQFRLRFGSSTFSTGLSFTQTSSGTNRTVVTIDWTLRNANVTGVQLHTVQWRQSAPAANETLTTFTDDEIMWATSTVDTTALTQMRITCDLDAASGVFRVKLVEATIVGPVGYS